MRIFLAIVFLGALCAWEVSIAQVAFTTKGRIVLSCNGTEVSQHNVETEATESAIRHAMSKGGSTSCLLKYPDKTLVIAIVGTGQPSGQAVVSWTPSAQPAGITVAGFRIHYGASPTQLIQTLQVANPAATSHTLTGLAPGVYYFAVRAYTANDQSDLSNTATKTVS
jgi:hypothetical protein